MIIPIVRAMLVNPNGELVYVLRSENSQQDKGKWSFPGGKREDWQNHRTALDDELQQEIGFVPNAYRYCFSQPLFKGNDKYYREDFFAARISGDVEFTLDKEHSQVKRMSLDEVATRTDIALNNREAHFLFEILSRGAQQPHFWKQQNEGFQRSGQLIDMHCYAPRPNGHVAFEEYAASCEELIPGFSIPEGTAREYVSKRG